MFDVPFNSNSFNANDKKELFVEKKYSTIIDFKRKLHRKGKELLIEICFANGNEK